jgi:hypothetical protein
MFIIYLRTEFRVVVTAVKPKTKANCLSEVDMESRTAAFIVVPVQTRWIPG